MKYQNTKTGVVAELVRENKKFKNVTLRDEAGNERDYSSATISRWWKKINEDDPTQEKIEDVEVTKVDPVKEVAAQLVAMASPVPEEVEENLVPMPGAEKLADLKEEVCGDGTPLAEVGKEIAEQAREKVRAAKKEKKPLVSIEQREKQVIDFLSNYGYTYKLCAGHVVRFNSSSRKNLYIYTGKNKAVLYLTKTNVPEGKKADRVANCPLSHRFDISYNSLEALEDFM